MQLNGQGEWKASDESSHISTIYIYVFHIVRIFCITYLANNIIIKRYRYTYAHYYYIIIMCLYYIVVCCAAFISGNAATQSTHVRIFGLNMKSIYGKLKIVHTHTTNIYTIESLSRTGNANASVCICYYYMYI